MTSPQGVFVMENKVDFVPDDVFLLIPMLIGLALLSIASLWMLIQAFVTHWGWGLGMFFAGLFTWPVYLIMHFKKAILPTLLAVVGVILIAGPMVYVATKVKKIQDTADSRVITVTKDDDAGRRVEFKTTMLTLTGAKRDEYTKLKSSKDWDTVLWANADVTDEDLEMLHGMTKIRVLDLSDAKITVEGLHVLEDLEALEDLKLARIGVVLTDKDFSEHLAGFEKLKALDVRGSMISKKALDEWKAKKDGRKYLK
jgi:hypothetical protein